MTDQRLEGMVANLLRAGVTLSGLIVAIGGVLYLTRSGGETANYHTFHVLPAQDRLIPQILSAAVDGRARSVMQAGILVLIATPILRVALSLVGFALERDRKYVVITAIVLAVLIYSLVNTAAAG